MTKRRNKPTAPLAPLDRKAPAGWARWGWLAAGLLGLIFFLPSLAYDFTYDDLLIVEENRRIRDLGNPSAYLLTSYWNKPGQHREYRPLTMLSYALNYAATGNNPLPFHAVNVALHAGICMLIWLMLMKLFNREDIAAIASALFAVHPIHVEAVAGVVGRAELLSAFGFLAAFIFSFNSWRSPHPGRRWLWAAGTGAFALIAFGSKENGVTLLPVLFLIPFFAPAPDREHSAAALPPIALFARLIPALVFCALALAAYLIPRILVVGGLTGPPDGGISPVDNPLATLTGVPRVLSAVKLLPRYALMLIWPFHPSPDYSWGAIPLVVRIKDPSWIWGAMSIPLFFYVAWRLRRRPASFFGMLFFFFTFAITSNILFPIGTILAERLLYLPSLGFCLLAADLAVECLRRLRRPSSRQYGGKQRAPAWIAVGALGLWSFALAGQTLRYLPVWKNNETLNAYMSRRMPQSARVQYFMGLERLRNERYDEAARHLEQSLEIRPGVPQFMSSLALAYAKLGQIDKAQKLWEEVLHENPNDVTAIMNLARIYHRRGQTEKAEEMYPFALEADPGNFNLRLDYGMMLEEIGKDREAIRVLEKLLPPPGGEDNRSVALTLGRAHFKLGEYREALTYLQRARRVAPDDREVLLRLAQTWLALGDRERARDVAGEMRDLHPDDPMARQLFEALNRPRAE